VLRRRSRFALLATAVVLVVAGTGCLPLVRPPGAAPLRYRDAVFADVAKQFDVVYGSAVDLSGRTVSLELDVYEPAGDQAVGRPAVVWVHGGSFCCGDKSSPELVDEMTTFARQGYVNVSINYRLEPGGCSAGGPTATCLRAIREAFEDAQAAVRFLRANAASYGVDPTRIAIAGTSAGAITALHVGYRSAEDPASAVRAAVSLSGSNILAPIGAGDAPALLFHGTDDTLVPYQWAANTVSAAKAAGLFVHLTTWQGAGHVPYLEHRAEILGQTSNFLYWTLDLAGAPQL
jgi:acetyl esterase/lipase